jgi:flavin reductase (DIM6/NTAB) family NADH-FMN oxidoreductase RutF
MIVSSLQCISFDPPMLSVALAKDSIKGEAISDSGRFRARLLRHGEEKLCRGERLPSTPALLEVQCLISAIYAAGDHHLVLATVEQLSTSARTPRVSTTLSLSKFAGSVSEICCSLGGGHAAQVRMDPRGAHRGGSVLCGPIR